MRSLPVAAGSGRRYADFRRIHRRDSYFSYSADAQGRVEETTLADGRVTKRDVSHLADRCLPARKVCVAHS